MTVKFTIPGEPQGKGRPIFSRLNNGGVSTRTPENTVLYENLVKTEFRNQCKQAKFEDEAMIDIRVICYYTIPKSASKKKKALMLAHIIRPTKKPDADNVLKSIADSLNKIAYRDDAQIVDAQIRKFYSSLPRVEVTLKEVRCEADI